MYADLHAASAAEHRRDLLRVAAESRVAALVRCCRTTLRRALTRRVPASTACA
jgi:hypothetical protein